MNEVLVINFFVFVLYMVGIVAFLVCCIYLFFHSHSTQINNSLCHLTFSCCMLAIRISVTIRAERLQKMT